MRRPRHCGSNHPFDDSPRRIRRDGEAKGSAAIASRVDPDDFSSLIKQRSTAIAGGQHGIRLNRAFHHRTVVKLQSAIQPADNASGQSRVQSVRTAYSHNGLSHDQSIRIAKSHRIEAMTCCINFDDSEVDARIHANQLRLGFVSVVEYNGQGSGVFDHMGIGDDMSFMVEYKTGAASRVKPADFDLYRHNRWADVAINVCFVLRPKWHSEWQCQEREQPKACATFRLPFH